MALRKETKAEVMKNFAQHASDSGSSEVQVALLSERITQLTEHFKTHTHDFASKHGLLKLIGQRKSLLNYIERNDEAKYKELIQKLGLRK